VKLLTQKLAEHGYIYCVTDWEEYAEHMLSVFAQEVELQNPYDGYAPSRSWRPQTSFERKGIEKSHPIREVWVEKVSRG
jgi:tRNA (guanine-N7-)-methyltransferase